ncbi:alpha/beta hydrolase [Pseudomonas sp. HMWF032]|uniref:alpha/beta fold hydrolase n=1 Tax=Pseudomonas sp. HMWF032 TaxID=2056866 RepID=UPI000D3B3B87|nr:alpha/beta hydrolase [Pseudomonas sp. HMWF032]PTS85903.1 alpha/beta hydrolase [Pseudomonas sp. HMWF032]PTT80571.1 alpha/beta hydrolase [Pseudomonas sp. HMWF010]
MHYRTDYCAAQLNEPPQTLDLGELRLHYQAYAQHSQDLRPPVLMLGGAFQSFRSFAAEVSELLEQHPVILLDLPSQGGNLQLVPQLTLEQLADLIADFAEELNLPPLMPIGLSYGSALAALFAARHPTRCARVLLAGITAFGRPGARLLLQEGLALLADGRNDAFAYGALTGLLNPLRLEQTGVAPVFRKALLRQIQRLSAADVERYRQNSQRLLDFQGFNQHPCCPTLVLAGEHDHFTQPWEHAHFAAACAQASCALIHNADHLAQFEQREACASLYNPFLRGETLPQRSLGSSLLPHPHLLQLEKRFEPRQPPNHRHARLQHRDGGEWTVEVSELGFFGGLLQADLPTIRGTRGWQLLCKDLPAQPLLPLRQDANGLAFVFPHSDQHASQALESQFQLQQPLPTAACA